MRDASPVVGRGGKTQAAHLGAGEHVPEAEFHGQLSAVFAARDFPGHQSLGIDLAPVGEARQVAQLLGRLNERAPVDRAEQAGALEIGAHHVGDLLPARGRARRLAVEFGDGDRQGLDHTFGDVELELCDGRPRQAAPGTQYNQGPRVADRGRPFISR